MRIQQRPQLRGRPLPPPAPAAARRPPRHPYPMAAGSAWHRWCRVPGALLAAPAALQPRGGGAAALGSPQLPGAERGRPRPRERPPWAGLPWPPAPPGARRQRLRPPGGRQRWLRGRTGPLLQANGEALAFSARDWRRLRRFSPGRARPRRAPRASEAERDGAGGAHRAPRRRSP